MNGSELSDMTSDKHIVVIGAGVIGLQSAIALLRASYSVTIIAEHLPGDTNDLYTSPWAGAQWRTHAAIEDAKSCQWDSETYQDWITTVRREEAEGRIGDSGLEIATSNLYWTSPPSKIQHGPSSIWWRSVVDNFRTIPKEELPPGVSFGASFTTIAVDVPRHLKHLLQTFQSLGGKIIKALLPVQGGLDVALMDAAALVGGNIYAYVNATGIKAKFLIGDDRVYPIRGQTVIVKGKAKNVVTVVGKSEADISYVIPRSGSTVLGGTREAGDWNTQTDDQTTAKILESCKKLAPELLDAHGEFEVLSVNVGLRPSRKGGPRTETEIIGRKNIVVHSYGHSGAGYQNSIGNAKEVVRLLREHERNPGFAGSAKL